MPAFRKEHIDALFGEIEANFKEKPEREQLHRDAHLAIALHDADRDLSDDIDSRVVDLVDRHKPQG
jgi:hypothetical protein